MTLQKLLQTLLAASFCASGAADAQEVTLLKETQMTNKALHFDAAKFSNRISPHGDCLDIVNDYIFAVWYAGGMDDRRVHISRKKIGADNWVDMTLDDAKNSLYSDGQGDSHKTANIGISPIDGTIHVAYDHHSGRLNYISSKKGAAFVSDSEWNSSLMNPRTSQLSGTTVSSCTYPGFFRNSAGDLILYYRHGGSTNGDWRVAFYNGTNWSIPKSMVDGDGAPDGDFNAYCEFTYYNDQVYYIASVRRRDNLNLNRGLFYATVEGQTGTGSSFTTRAGLNVSTPILTRADIYKLQVAEPDVSGHVNGRHLVVTPDGTLYFAANDKLWMSNPGETTFASKRGTSGDLMGINDKVFSFDVTGSGGSSKDTIKRVTSGSDNWQTVYTGPGRNINGNYTVRAYRNKIIAICQRDGGTQRIIDCLEYDTGEPDTSTAVLAPTYGNGGIPGTGEPWPVNSTTTTRIEAENFDQGANGQAYSDSTPENQGTGSYRTDSEVDILDTSDLGAGSQVGYVTAGEWLQFTIDVESTRYYDLTFRYSKGSASVSNLRVLSNGADLAGEIEMPTTDDWSSYSSVTKRVLLDAGPQVLRIQFVDGSMNLNWFEFTPVVPDQIEMAIVGPLAVSSDAATWTDNQPAHTGADYIVQKDGQLRSETGTSSFPGFSLTVKPEGRFQFRSLDSNNEITTVNNLILEGGTAGFPAGLQAGTGSNDTNVLAGNIKTSGHVQFLTFDKAGGSPISRSIKVLSKISGDGRIEAWEGLPGQGGEVVTITNAGNTFSGIWEVAAGSSLIFTDPKAVGPASILVSNGNLQIDGNWNSTATLSFNDSSNVEIQLGAQHWSVGNLEFGSSSVQDGVYRAADLNSVLENPVFTGTGTLTIGSVAPGGPIAHWKFDEGKGTTAGDASGSGHTGTLLHGASWASDETRASYLRFDGDDDRVSTLFTYALSDSDDFTWSWWANQQSTGDTDKNALMVGNRYGGTGSESLEFIKFTTTKGEFRNDSNDSYDYDDVIPGSWHHYAMVKTANSYQWYVDGEAQGSPKALSYTENNPLPFNIGGDDNNSAAGGQTGEHFEGFIDEVVLYDRALSPGEVALVKNSTNEAAVISELAEWRIRYFGSDDEDGIAALDHDGNFDGEDNMLEFATGQDPYAATLVSTPVKIVGTMIEFRYTRSKAAMADGVTFQVKWSDTLLPGSWSMAGVTESMGREDAEVQERVAEVPMGTSGARFMHLEITP
jgi:hypothetical protein